MTKKNYPLVSIVIVEYKNDPYLSNLLSSIANLSYSKSSLEIIIVSILSKGKKIHLKEIPVKQISINRKTGYAEAANIGISHSLGTYIFSPNPDTTIEKTALRKMVDYIHGHDDVGIVGPKVFLLNDPSKISSHDLPCKYFNKLWGKITVVTADELAPIVNPQEFYWLCGNGIVLKKTIWEKANKYDESFFLYWEDADFSMKVRLQGYKSVMIPDAKLFHKGSASVGNTDDQVYYIVRNGRHFQKKYTWFVGQFLQHITNILLLISKSFQIILGVPDVKKSQAFIDGIIDFYKGKRGSRER